MGDPLGSFIGESVSEDKARWKDSYWFVGTVVDLGCHIQNFKYLASLRNKIKLTYLKKHTD